MTAIKSYDTLTLTVISDRYDDYEYTHKLGDSTAVSETGAIVSSEIVRGDILSMVKGKGTGEEYIDARKITFPVTIRNFRAGDVIAQLNMTGTKKLKDIFIDKKLPTGKRRTAAVLLATDTIFLVHGVCVSNDYKVTKNTKEAVKFTYTTF